MKNWMMIGLSLLLFTACGGDDDDGGSCSSDNECKGDRVCQSGSCVSPGGQNNGNNANNGNNGNNVQNNANNSTASCCLNGSFFDCNGDAAAANACFNTFDPGSCVADASRDGECGGANNVNNGNNANNANNAQGGVGDSCRDDSDCSSDLCLFDSGAVVGYCTDVCQSFSDCPSFWDCEEVGNGSGTYCVNNG